MGQRWVYYMATITARGDGQWQAKIRKAGFPAISKTFRLKSDAASWAKKLESEMERGVWLEKTEADSTTLADTLNRYLAEIVSKKKGGAKETSTIQTWLDTHISKTFLSKVRSADISVIMDTWLAQGYAPATVVRRVAVLSNLFTVARKRWGMTGLINPAEGVQKPKVSNARTRRVSPDEIDRICRATESSVLPNIVRLAVETAARREELTRLTWKNIKLQDRTALLPDTKNGEDRYVPLSPTAIALLEGMPKSLSGRVFGITPDALTRAFTRATVRARATYERECIEEGIEPDAKLLLGLTFHDLRREATSRMAATFQAHELAKITGHKDLKMVLRYYQADAAALALRMK